MWRERMRTVTVEILDKGEMILGSRTNGQFMVRKFEDDIEMGGEFFKTVEEAGKAVTDWSGLHYLNNTIIDLNLNRPLQELEDSYWEFIELTEGEDSAIWSESIQNDFSALEGYLMKQDRL